MKPIEFPEQTTVIAKDQPPYLPLPAFVSSEETISRWQISWRERLSVFVTGRIWLRQLNFGKLLQPQQPTTEYPFAEMGHE